MASITIKCPAGGSDCTIPTDTCCRTTGADGGPVYTCEALKTCTSASATSVVNCFGTSDCATGSICCLDATGESTANLTCSPGPTCPAGSGLAEAQICAGNSDCTNGKCVTYSCDGNAITACEGSVSGIIAGECTLPDAGPEAGGP